MKGIRLAAEQKQKAEESTGEGEGPESGSTYSGEAAKNPEVSGTPETSSSKPQTQAVSAVNYQVYTVEEGRPCMASALNCTRIWATSMRSAA